MRMRRRVHGVRPPQRLGALLAASSRGRRAAMVHTRTVYSVQLRISDLRITVIRVVNSAYELRIHACIISIRLSRFQNSRFPPAPRAAGGFRARASRVSHPTMRSSAHVGGARSHFLGIRWLLLLSTATIVLIASPGGHGCAAAARAAVLFPGGCRGSPRATLVAWNGSLLLVRVVPPTPWPRASSPPRRHMVQTQERRSLHVRAVGGRMREPITQPQLLQTDCTCLEAMAAPITCTCAT